MKEIEETELPGMGKKFAIELLDGTMTIVIHTSGMREICIEQKGNSMVFLLTDDEARRAGAILSGTYFTPTPTDMLHQIISKKLMVEAFKIPPSSPTIGKMISELDIRKKTETSIIAITRDDRHFPNPKPDTKIEENDVLLVIGAQDSIKKFEKMIKEG
ncbi:MAG: TrkA C-terminal domain-containing protein [Candidatus Thermoplasmatota archaeon]